MAPDFVDHHDSPVIWPSPGTLDVGQVWSSSQYTTLSVRIRANDKFGALKNVRTNN